MVSKENPDPEYDVIVIGAGIGGLTCAAALVKGCRKVLVCEQHSQPGGYVTSFERKGFAFDGGTQSLSWSCWIFPILKDLGILDKTKLVKISYQIVTSDVDLKLESIQTIVSELKRMFPEDSNGIETYFRIISEFIVDLTKIAPAFMDVAIPLRRWKKILFYLKLPICHFRFLVKMIKYSKTTAKDLVDSYITNEKLKFLLSSRSSIITEAMNWHWFIEDNWWPVGGMQKLANLFAEMIKEGDGIISLGTKVEKILIENRRAVGVKLENGNEIRSRFVVSNVDYKQTFTKLVGSIHLEKDFIKRVEKAKVSNSVLSVYLGVDVNKEALKKIRAQHVICYLAYERKSIKDPDFYKYCSDFWICIPSLVDDSLAPKGKSVIIIQASASYDYMDKWQTENRKRTKAYKELKQKVANELIATAEKIIPELSKHIDVIEVATPLTMERYTLNTNGATTGWGEGFHKGFFGGSIRTPIKNLYVVGHWSFNIGGVAPAMLAGKKAAEDILEKYNNRRLTI